MRNEIRKKKQKEKGKDRYTDTIRHILRTLVPLPFKN